MNKRVNFIETNDKSTTTLPQNETPQIQSRSWAQNRWRKAYEKLKMKQLFWGNDPEQEETQELNTPSVKAQTNLRSHSKHKTHHIHAQNLIAQKFANILKKQFNSLSAKQYKLINDACYNDVDEDFKRRQKLKKKLELTFLTNLDKKTRKRLVMLPDGFFRVSFDIFAMILIVWELILIPILLSFQDIELSDGFDIFSNMITSFFLIDLVLNFNTAFYERGHIVTERGEICRHYLRTCSFPYDMVIDELLLDIYDDQTSSNAKSISQSAKLLRILQFIKFLRVLRLLRAFKLKRIFGKLEDYLQLSPSLNAALALIRLSFMIVCIAHWCACGFHLVVVFEDTNYPTNWLRQLHIENEDWSTRYLTSFYWALTTMTTIGYGDVTPVTNAEKIYGMFIMILSSGIFGYTMNRIGNILQSFNETSLEYKVKLFQINQYMKRKNVPKELQARVRKYLEYTLDPEKANQIDEKVLVQTLSKNLHEEITVFINGNIIKQYEFLYKIFSPDLLFKISFYIKEHIYGPEEIIINENVQEDDPAIYFLTSGVVTVYYQAGSCFFNVLKEGSYFGEISFFSNIRRTASVKSSDFISLYVLRRNDFWTVITRENLREDREVFCQLRDKLELYKDHLLLNIVCYSCYGFGHVAKNCPEVHYYPKPEDVIKNKLMMDRKQRKEFKRIRRKFKAKNHFSFLQSSAHAIRNAMFLYHEAGIKEHYRVETDMGDFLDENPKGYEPLNRRIGNYKEPLSTRLRSNPINLSIVPRRESASLDLDSGYSVKAIEMEDLKSDDFSKSQKTGKNLISQEYNQFWNDFERIEICTKYFIHNNFNIVKKKLKNEESYVLQNENRRISVQNRIKLLKQKTIKNSKKRELIDIVCKVEARSRESENHISMETGLLMIKTSKMSKRGSSLDARKDCEHLIEKFGVENVFNIAKQKIESGETKKNSLI